LQSGGSANGALVGSPWTPKIADWPGVGGKDGQTNYFSMNKYHVDPQTETISERNQITYTPQNGGTRRRKAGGLIPQDLVNLGRSMVYGVGSAYNSLNGYATPVNPLPYKDQLVNTASSKSLGNF
jgi:ribosomal protein S6E (S10)